MHLWLALLLIAAMGLVLGLLGGGGSISTAPILVYGLRVEASAGDECIMGTKFQTETKFGMT